MRVLIYQPGHPAREVDISPKSIIGCLVLGDFEGLAQATANLQEEMEALGAKTQIEVEEAEEDGQQP